MFCSAALGGQDSLKLVGVCYLDGIVSFLWEEEVVGAERSSLNVNVSSLSRSVVEGQESQENQR